ncbi:hypothetical protein MTR67_051619 [Solanum verrucosum]|uniref:Uncharacterized protein n=1 Tax=Solanum verrucosum TaxID=315347 RepID=A0AAF1A2W3_SOLVR|nr:hypothetical protein MTR67_051619 [Solanum verrucosum]
MVHLYRNGFKPRYFVWIDHEESDGLDGMLYNLMPVDAYNMVAPHGQIRVEQVRVEHDRVHEMINDTFGVQGGMEPEQYFDEAPNEEARHFYDKLEESSCPLCEGSLHSALSVAAKRFVSKLGLTYDRIHCCVNGCMLFYKTDSELENCKFCGHARYKRTPAGKMVPVQAMHYLPLIPRLKRLYTSMSELGNVRLGLCSDGFTPFSNNTSPYSCWPVYDEYSSVQHLQLVREVTLVPESQVLTMNKYCVNGFKFQTEEVSRNKKTNNSGVYIQGDVDGIGQTIEYYGVIQEIIEVRYSCWPKKKIVLFRCTSLQLSAMRLGDSSSKQSNAMAGMPPLTQHFMHLDVSPSSTATPSATPDNTMPALATGQKDILGRVMIEPDG